MIRVDYDIPIPAFAVVSVIMFLLSIVCAAWASYDRQTKTNWDAAQMGIYSVVGACVASLALFVVATGVELPLDGKDWIAAIPFMLAGVGICLVVFLLAELYGRLLRKAERRMKEREERKSSSSSED